MSSQQSVKIQITLPLEVSEKIDKEIKESYTKKSLWFLKIIEEHFNNKEKNPALKKVIKLEI